MRIEFEATQLLPPTPISINDRRSCIYIIAHSRTALLHARACSKHHYTFRLQLLAARSCLHPHLRLSVGVGPASVNILYLQIDQYQLANTVGSMIGSVNQLNDQMGLSMKTDGDKYLSFKFIMRSYQIMNLASQLGRSYAMIRSYLEIDIFIYINLGQFQTFRGGTSADAAPFRPQFLYYIIL